MPKQEYKILEFHGGTNNKFDARDIADNQNAFSQFSIRHPGRLVKEGGAKILYDKTNINGHSITDISGSSGGFEKGYGLFHFLMIILWSQHQLRMILILYVLMI